MLQIWAFLGLSEPTHPKLTKRQYFVLTRSSPEETLFMFVFHTHYCEFTMFQHILHNKTVSDVNHAQSVVKRFWHTADAIARIFVSDSSTDHPFQHMIMHCSLCKQLKLIYDE